MCFHGLGKMRRKKGFMDFGLFTRIVEENKSILREKPVDLDNAGEPLLHPRISDMVRLLHEEGIASYFSTNATLLTKSIARKLIESGLDGIIFSFDGVTKNTYEKIRVGASFDAVLRNIVNFLELKRKLKADNPVTTMQILLMKETKHEVLNFIKFATKLGVDQIVIKRTHAWGHEVESWKKVILKPCKAPWSSVVILWDGTVSLCCRDYNAEFPLGNLNSQSLKEIWNGARMQYVRKLMARGMRYKIPPCTYCEVSGYPRDVFYLRRLTRALVKRIIKRRPTEINGTQIIFLL